MKSVIRNVKPTTISHLSLFPPVFLELFGRKLEKIKPKEKKPSNIDLWPMLFLTLSLRVARWVDHNADLPSDSKISKMELVNVTFTSTLLVEY